MQRRNQRCACFRSVYMMPLNSTATGIVEIVYSPLEIILVLLKPKTQTWSD